MQHIPVRTIFAHKQCTSISKASQGSQVSFRTHECRSLAPLIAFLSVPVGDPLSSAMPPHHVLAAPAPPGHVGHQARDVEASLSLKEKHISHV